jgi:hypothetical protein
MARFYDEGISSLHKYLLDGKTSVERSLSIIEEQNTDFAGDHRRILVIYQLLLSRFEEYV